MLVGVKEWQGPPKPRSVGQSEKNVILLICDIFVTNSFILFTKDVQYTKSNLVYIKNKIDMDCLPTLVFFLKQKKVSLVA